jgi:hypothetical protein
VRVLKSRIESCLDVGGRVVLIDLFDTPPERNPWKFLRRLGYGHATVERTLERLPVEKSSRRVGPFTVRKTAPILR